MNDAFILNLRAVARCEIATGRAELGHIIDVAADKIDRLRADNNLLDAEGNRMRAEIEHLCAALRTIAADPDTNVEAAAYARYMLPTGRKAQ